MTNKQERLPLQRGGQRAAEMNEFQHWFPERIFRSFNVVLLAIHL